MAHELDTRTNEAGEEIGHAMFSVVETPWHQLGTVLTEAPDLDEAMRIGGLDWEVEKRSNWFEVPVRCRVCEGAGTVGGTFRFARICKACDGRGTVVEMQEATTGFSIVRIDRQADIGTVGPEYHPLQNRQAFEVLEPLLDKGIARIETGGSLRGGRDVWMLFSLDSEKILEAAGNDPLAQLLAEVQPFALITNNHAGQRKVTVKETPVRVVCANTLEASLSADDIGCTVKIEHSKNVVANVQAAAAMLFGDIVGRFSQFGEVRECLVDTHLPDAVFDRLVLDPVVPIEHLFRKIQRKEAKPQTLTAHTKASEKRQEIRRLWHEGEDHLGDGNAWEAYNGVVQALDHDERFHPGTAKKDPVRRLQSMYDGNIRQSKRRVLRGLHQFACTDDEVERDEQLIT